MVVFPILDSGVEMARRRPSLPVLFKERIQQRDQDSQIETASIRSKVHVEHTGELRVSCSNRAVSVAYMRAVFWVV